MHRRSGTWVQGHYRHGTWVEGHHRSGSVVDDGYHSVNYSYQNQNREPKKSSNKALYYWIYTGKITFLTNCWWCGEEVYFHRDENGGCVLFDDLGKPWPIHSCWEDHKHEQSEAVAYIINNYKNALQDARIESYKYASTISSESFDAFLVGCDFSRRIILNKDTPQLKELYFRYIIYAIPNIGHIKILVPEITLEPLLSKTHVFLEVITHKRGASVVNFTKSLRFEGENTENSIKFTIKPEDHLQYKWIYQYKLTS
ncbi:hypothetical protein [Methylomagnum sp.]